MIQVILRHGIFGSDPGGRLFRTVVFEPAVGVGDFGAEVVIHDFRTLGIGISRCLIFIDDLQAVSAAAAQKTAKVILTCFNIF